MFSKGNRRYSDAEVIQSVRDITRIIITGNGGQGKTLFTKYMWLALFENPYGRIPILIELRDVKKYQDATLITMIRFALSINGNLDEATFFELCRLGAFIFIFDGLDEVASDKMEYLSKDIIDMAKYYQDCGFVVTSRPGNEFSGWSEFEIFKVLPFEYRMTKQLLEKVPFDDVKRKMFLKNFDNNFFKITLNFYQTRFWQ